MTRAARAALASLMRETEWNGDVARLEIADTPAAIASPLPISDAAAGAYGALALAAAEFGDLRGLSLSPRVNRRLAGLANAGNEYLTVDGTAPKTWGNITGYYRCADGASVYCHGIFEHLRDGLLDLFGAEDARASMAERIASWTAEEAEASGQARGLCVMRLRTRAEWEAHPQHAALAAQPVLRIAPFAGDAGAARGLPPLSGGDGPLNGVRVLDLTRVIAGPMAGRALAELGADVLRVSGPDLPVIEPLVIDTGFGKRNAEIDLRTDRGRAILGGLIRDADVLIDGYRPGALAAKGFGTEALAALNPGLIHVRISAFSDVGPWAGRRGYDSYVQAGVGLTAPANPDDPPVRLPCQPLDYLTGCLSACGAIIALTRREKTGRGGAVEMSLARTAMWIWEMADALGPDPAPPARNPTEAEARAEGVIREMESGFGKIGSLAPPYGFAERRAEWPAPPQPLASAPPEWI
ncbi:MAG: CoA transferase [Pseudomonadota bacterium]